jgi:hypothetical protein
MLQSVKAGVELFMPRRCSTSPWANIFHIAEIREERLKEAARNQAGNRHDYIASNVRPSNTD